MKLPSKRLDSSKFRVDYAGEVGGKTTTADQLKMYGRSQQFDRRLKGNLTLVYLGNWGLKIKVSNPQSPLSKLMREFGQRPLLFPHQPPPR